MNGMVRRRMSHGITQSMMLNHQEDRCMNPRLDEMVSSSSGVHPPNSLRRVRISLSRLTTQRTTSPTITMTSADLAWPPAGETGEAVGGDLSDVPPAAAAAAAPAAPRAHAHAHAGMLKGFGPLEDRFSGSFLLQRNTAVLYIRHMWSCDEPGLAPDIPEGMVSPQRTKPPVASGVVASLPTNRSTSPSRRWRPVMLNVTVSRNGSNRRATRNLPSRPTPLRVWQRRRRQGASATGGDGQWRR
jgi:hypothetical protein